MSVRPIALSTTSGQQGQQGLQAQGHSTALGSNSSSTGAMSSDPPHPLLTSSTLMGSHTKLSAT